MSSRMKQKLLLAVGERQLEEFIKSKMSDEFTFTKEASYREIVIKRIREERPDVILIREALKGSMTIDSLILDIRENYPDVRVVFYTSKNRPGEPLLKQLVSYGVYDLIGGETITESQIYDGLLKPKRLSDVRQYLDAPTIQGDEPPMLVKAEYIEKEKVKEEPIDFPPLAGATPEVVPKENKEEKSGKGFLGRLFRRNNKDEPIDEEQQAIEYTPEEHEESYSDNQHTGGSTHIPEEDKMDGYKNPLELFGSNRDEDNDTTNHVTEEVPKQVPDKTVSFEDINIPDIEFGSDWEVDEQVGLNNSLSEEPEEPAKSNDNNQEQHVQHEERAKPDERLLLQARGKPKQQESGSRVVKGPEKINKPVIRETPKVKEKSRSWLASKKDDRIQVKSNQIITFISAVNGVGNTHIAFNTALKLADEGNRILYIDMNSSFSSVDFSFQLGTWQQGIDKALEDIEYNSGMNASDNIIRMRDVKIQRKEDKQLQELYKSLPDTLDYLFYSLDYQTLEQQHPVPKDRLRDLIMYLMTRERYDAVIIDSEPLGTPGVDGLLNLSNKIYFTMTQDPGQMGVFHRQFDAAKKRVNITDERYIIVNQFVDVEPKVKRIQKWTNEEVLQTIPFTHKSVILANFLGEPFILKTKHKDAIEAFDALARHLAQ